MISVHLLPSLLILKCTHHIICKLTRPRALTLHQPLCCQFTVSNSYLLFNSLPLSSLVMCMHSQKCFSPVTCDLELTYDLDHRTEPRQCKGKPACQK